MMRWLIQHVGYLPSPDIGWLDKLVTPFMRSIGVNREFGGNSRQAVPFQLRTARALNQCIQHA